jgi:hypothetical protein
VILDQNKFSFEKISMVVFLFGVLIALFSGSFQVLEHLRLVKTIVLVLFGIVIGLLNISKDEERGFMLSTIVFVVCSKLISSSMQDLALLSNISLMLNNLVLLVSPAAMVIALKNVFVFAYKSEIDMSIEVNSKKRMTLEIIWDVILVVSVSFVFIILVLETFFNVENIQNILNITDICINVVFVIDLIILFRKSSSFNGFVKNNWIDIIAVIPLGPFFQAIKLIRAIKIVKIISSTEKLLRGAEEAAKVGKASARVTRSNKLFKFFSDDSGFNNYVSDKSKKDKQKKSGSKALKK